MQEERIGNATEFLDACRASVRRIRAASERLDDIEANGHLKAVSYSGGGQRGSFADKTAGAAMERERLWARAKEAADEYARLLYTAQEAFSAMEADGADTEGDIALLDYFYLQGKTLKECARLLDYSDNWIRNKKALAIVHVAPYVPLSW